MAKIVNISLSTSRKRKAEDTQEIDAEITDIYQNDSLSEISFGRKLSEVSEEDVSSEQAVSDIQISGTQSEYVHTNSPYSTTLAENITQDELVWLNETNNEYRNKQRDLHYIQNAEDTQGKQDKCDLITVNNSNVLNVNDTNPNFVKMSGPNGPLAQGGDPDYNTMPTNPELLNRPTGESTKQKLSYLPKLPIIPPIGSPIQTEFMRHQNSINTELLRASTVLIDMKHNDEKELKIRNERDT
jgi:hypothetical protein